MIRTWWFLWWEFFPPEFLIWHFWMFHLCFCLVSIPGGTWKKNRHDQTSFGCDSDPQMFQDPNIIWWICRSLGYFFDLELQTENGMALALAWHIWHCPAFFGCWILWFTWSRHSAQVVKRTGCCVRGKELVPGVHKPGQTWLYRWFVLDCFAGFNRLVEWATKTLGDPEVWSTSLGFPWLTPGDCQSKYLGTPKGLHLRDSGSMDLPNVHCLVD